MDDYRVNLNVTGYTIGYRSADGGYRLASVGGLGNLERLPERLRPTYPAECAYSWDSKRDALEACDWLNNRAELEDRVIFINC